MRVDKSGGFCGSAATKRHPGAPYASHLALSKRSPSEIFPTVFLLISTFCMTDGTLMRGSGADSGTTAYTSSSKILVRLCTRVLVHIGTAAFQYFEGCFVP
jgi:hypothetical protein